ncbi:MAG: glycoside hydrolase family 3 C-terminal domain-containing protein [Puniceicoccaceae bacterium]
MTTEEKLSQINWKNKAIPRLGIPAYVWCSEGLHGVARAGAATVFPQPIGMAASFSTDRVRDMGEVLTIEARARHHESLRQGDHGTYKGITYWSPNINIFRDPRWGRGHETYGEDPHLTSVMGSTFVRTIQGPQDKYLQLVATPKHFAVHSGPELDRLSFNSVVDERDLRETYLPAFKACIEAGARSIMTAYNAINGEPCATNKYLVRTILQEEWGFDGVIVTDGGAGEALYKNHKRVQSYADAVCLALSNGVDIMTDWEDMTHEALESGKLSEEDLNRSVFKQLKLKFALGMFDDPNEVPLADTPYEMIEAPEHLEKARLASSQSLVLLKNEGALLPLNMHSLKNIAVIGPNADSREVLLGNYHGTPSRHVTVYEGVRDSVGPGCRVWLAQGCEHLSSQTEACAEEDDRYAEAVAVSQRSDVVVLCLGLTPRIEGEAGDAFNAEAGGDRLSIELPQPQEELIRRIAKTGKPIIVLMLSGSSIYSPLLETHCQAILQCWYPGAEGGEVIAETLFGQHNPAGRLPVTFYKSTDDLPDFRNYGMDGRTYRFFKGEAAFPFGYGLSYTRFDYDAFNIQESGARIEVSATVSNTGELDGDEVVQVYASQTAPFRTPVCSLIAFERVPIKKGEKRQVSLSIPKERLKLTDPEGRQSMYPGEVTVFIGGCQPDARSKELTGKPCLSKTLQLNT